MSASEGTKPVPVHVLNGKLIAQQIERVAHLAQVLETVTTAKTGHILDLSEMLTKMLASETGILQGLQELQLRLLEIERN